VLKGNEVLFLAGSGGRVNWCRNLVADPNVTVGVRRLRLKSKAVTAFKSKDFVPEILNLFREKYGAGDVRDWYTGTKRAAARIRLIEGI
jgi:hypothetical protein